MAHIVQRMQREQSGGLAVLLVSLYLMLLAFFILLQSISTFDEQHAQKAVSSLQESFEHRISGVNIAPGERVKSAPTIRDFYAELRVILEPLNIPMDLEVLDVKRQELRIRMPIDAVISSQGAWTAEGLRVSEQLVRLLANWREKTIPVFFAATLDQTPPDKDAGEHVRIASHMAHSFNRNGIPSAYMMASVSHAVGSEMTWSFRMHYAQ